MSGFPRLISLTTVLISLQLFSQNRVEARVEISLPNNLPVNQLLIASPQDNLQELSQIFKRGKDFEPRDNGHPDSTQGSGTR
ncbi:MAG TPA: hypothetical protein V6C95_04830 [Coleofasciculaceae cyanobacterium]